MRVENIEKHMKRAIDINWINRKVLKEGVYDYYINKPVKKYKKQTEHDYREVTVAYYVDEDVKVSERSYLGGDLNKRYKKTVSKEYVPYWSWRELTQQINRLEEQLEQKTTKQNLVKIVSKLKKMVDVLTDLNILAVEQVEHIEWLVRTLPYITDGFKNDFITEDLLLFSNQETLISKKELLAHYEKELDKYNEKLESRKKDKEIKKLMEERQKLDEKINSLV